MLLGCTRIITQRNLSAHRETLLLRFDAYVQFVMSESECVAVQCGGICGSDTKNRERPEEAEYLHFVPCMAPWLRLCLTIS